MLPLWPPVPAEEKRLARREARAPTGRREKQGHRWAARRQGWQCTRCLAVVTSVARRAVRQREECPGKQDAVMQLVANPKGHCLMAGDVNGSPFLICVKCGASTAKLRQLAVACSRVRAPAGEAALKLFQQGWTPEADPDQRRPVQARWRVHAGDASWLALPPPLVGLKRFASCSVADGGGRL